VAGVNATLNFTQACCFRAVLSLETGELAHRRRFIPSLAAGLLLFRC